MKHILIKCNKVNNYQKVMGLMLHTKITDPILFEFKKAQLPGKITVHNILVFQTIEVIFIDQDKKVVDYFLNFKPFNLPEKPNFASYSMSKIKYVLECPPGTVKNNKINLGDYIILEMIK